MAVICGHTYVLTNFKLAILQSKFQTCNFKQAISKLSVGQVIRNHFSFTLNTLPRFIFFFSIYLYIFIVANGHNHLLVRETRISFFPLFFVFFHLINLFLLFSFPILSLRGFSSSWRFDLDVAEKKKEKEKKTSDCLFKWVNGQFTHNCPHFPRFNAMTAITRAKTRFSAAVVKKVFVDKTTR